MDNRTRTWLVGITILVVVTVVIAIVAFGMALAQGIDPVRAQINRDTKAQRSSSSESPNDCCQFRVNTDDDCSVWMDRKRAVMGTDVIPNFRLSDERSGMLEIGLYAEPAIATVDAFSVDLQLRTGGSLVQDTENDPVIAVPPTAALTVKSDGDVSVDRGALIVSTSEIILGTPGAAQSWKITVSGTDLLMSAFDTGSGTYVMKSRLNA